MSPHSGDWRQRMRIPASPHFTPISLETAFNADRATLEGGLGAGTSVVPDWSLHEGYGEQTLRGIPFQLGEAGQPNVILLDPSRPEAEVRIEFEPMVATYLVVLHAVEDTPRHLPETF